MVFIEVLGSYDGFLRHFYGSCGSEEGFGVNALRSVLPNQSRECLVGGWPLVCEQSMAQKKGWA